MGRTLPPCRGHRRAVKRGRPVGGAVRRVSTVELMGGNGCGMAWASSSGRAAVSLFTRLQRSAHWVCRSTAALNACLYCTAGQLMSCPALPVYCSCTACRYEDDRDEGEWFLYTGSGGRDLSGNKRTNKEQSFDQVQPLQLPAPACLCVLPASLILHLLPVPSAWAACMSDGGRCPLLPAHSPTACLTQYHPCLPACP